MPDERKMPLRPGARPLGVPASKGIPGPAIREGGGTLPCGCVVAPDHQNTLRLTFCSPHAAAYEMMEALQDSLKVVDRLATSPPTPQYNMTPVLEHVTKARRVLKKAEGNWR